MNCFLCPRRCGADREAGKTGVCGASASLRAARCALHFWEEPCLSGTRGSGAVFFSGCSLRCVFCQNKDISVGGKGIEISEERLMECFFRLQEEGAHNINLVTPTHYADRIARCIEKAKAQGLSLPFIYNCGGYERVETLQRMEGLIDIYLPDFKYMSKELAARYSASSDYPDVAKEALDEMVRQQSEVVFDGEGMMTRGVLIRHMMLPGCLDDSVCIMDYLWHRYGYMVYFSLMSQYTPMAGIENTYPELARTVRQSEYEALVDFCASLGMENAFVQEGTSARESFIPAFDGTGLL